MVTRGALTSLWTAAPLRAAGAPDVTAAGVGAALTPADAQQEEDKEGSQADDHHEQPVCRERRTGPEPRGLAGNRDTDTAGQGSAETGRAKLFAKLGRKAVALVGFSVLEAGAQQQRDAHHSTTQASPKVRDLALGSWGKAENER